MQDGSKDNLDEAWARWEAALARVRERAPGHPGKREQRLWLLAHICGFGMLSYAVGYAVHRDGPWSPFVLLLSVVIACMLALIVVRLWAL